MAIGRKWAGRVYGTNTGNLFLKLNGADTELIGSLHINETDTGIAVYSVSGSFDGERLELTGEPATELESSASGLIKVDAHFDMKADLKGEWSSDTGGAGTFVLHPHDQEDKQEKALVKLPDQLHTARQSLGAIVIDREQVIALADDIQRDFRNSQVVVTVVAGTELSRFLTDFRNDNISVERPSILKLYAQEAEINGINKVVQIELGPHSNSIMTQGSDEAWVLGKLETLKRGVRPFERTYIANTKKLGLGVNQLLIGGSIAFLPSLETFRDRAILLFSVLLIGYVVDRLHARYLPLAAIYLGERPKGFIAGIAPSVISWVMGITASVITILLGAYLKGLLFPVDVVP